MIVWFLELAASVPRAEIVGKSEYFRFGMRDSLAIESAFLQVIAIYIIYITKLIDSAMEV